MALRFSSRGFGKTCCSRVETIAQVSVSVRMNSCRVLVSYLAFLLSCISWRCPRHPNPSSISWKHPRHPDPCHPYSETSLIYVENDALMTFLRLGGAAVAWWRISFPNLSYIVLTPYLPWFCGNASDPSFTLCLDNLVYSHGMPSRKTIEFWTLQNATQIVS